MAATPASRLSGNQEDELVTGSTDDIGLGQCMNARPNFCSPNFPCFG